MGLNRADIIRGAWTAVIIVTSFFVFKNRSHFVPLDVLNSRASTSAASRVAVGPDTDLHPDSSAIAPKVVIDGRYALTASFAASLGSQGAPNIPIGWGYMDPMVIMDAADFYAPIFFPCDAINRTVYCVSVYKNGAQSVSDTLRLGSIGDTPTEAYQPPMLFMTATKTIVVVAWSLDQVSVSTLTAYGLGARGAWRVLARVKTPQKTINYNGGAMARDGTIYIAGAGTASGQHSVELFKLPPPYTKFEGPQTVLSYMTESYLPLYIHVAVRSDGRISLLANLQNGNVCAEKGAVLTAYKIAAQWDGTWGGSFQGVWSDAPSDSLSQPDANGDNCYWRDSRFNYDMIYNSSDDKMYSLTKVTNLISHNPLAKLASNAIYTQKFMVRADGVVINDDVSPAFKNVFANLLDIEVMSMTHLDSGDFVIFAHNRNEVAGSPTQIGITTTKDFQTFTNAYRLETDFGPGQSVKVAQPYKNTPWSIGSLVFMHSGRLNSDTSLPNDHLQFAFAKGRVVP